jgi:hypothetical protein
VSVDAEFFLSSISRWNSFLNDDVISVDAGINPLAPAIIQVPNDNSQKTMSWPLVFAAPGENAPSPLDQKILERAKDPLWSDCKIETIPSRVVAVGSFSDASVAPIVRKADKALREVCSRDGISIPESTATSVKFAQYDAIFSLGKRRGEVWIELDEDGHPW